MKQKTIPASRLNAPIFVDQLISPKDGCSALDIGPTKLWELIADGHLEVVRLSRRCTRIKKSSIDRLIQSGLV